MQVGGRLVILGDHGRLLAERQSGGLVFARRSVGGPHAGRGRRGGRLVWLGDGDPPGTIDPDEMPLWAPIRDELLA